MFKVIQSNNPNTIDIVIEGQHYQVPEDISVAAAALLCDQKSVRETPLSGSQRLPFCMMGVCFDCLMKINGVPNQRACQVIVKPGMIIERQIGAASLEDYDEAAL